MGQKPKDPLPYFVAIIGTSLSVLLAQIFLKPYYKLDQGLKKHPSFLMGYFEAGSFQIKMRYYKQFINVEGILHLFLAVSGGDGICQTSLILDGKFILI